MTKRIRSFKRWLDRTYKKLLPKVTADSELAIMVNENEDPEIIAYLTEQHFPFYLYPDTVVSKNEFKFFLSKKDSATVGFMKGTDNE